MDPGPDHQSLGQLEQDHCDLGYLEFWQENEFKLEPAPHQTLGMDHLGDHFLTGGTIGGGAQQFGQLGLGAGSDPFGNQGVSLVPTLHDQQFQVQRNPGDCTCAPYLASSGQDPGCAVWSQAADVSLLSTSTGQGNQLLTTPALESYTSSYAADPLSSMPSGAMLYSAGAFAMPGSKGASAFDGGSTKSQQLEHCFMSMAASFRVYVPSKRIKRHVVGI